MARKEIALWRYCHRPYEYRTARQSFQAEVFATLTCAYRGLERGYKSKHSNPLSQSALKALESYQVSSKLVWECLQTLQLTIV